MLIVLAQLNLCVGDITGNTEQIIDSVHCAQKQHKADVIVFPELSLSGYPPEDLLYRPAFHNHAKEALHTLCASAREIDIIVGHPHYQIDRIYNACSLLRDGRILHTYHKQCLPNYGVFDEKRYFYPGAASCVFDLKGIPTAVSICEDIWEKDVCIQAAAAGAKLMININASPYHLDKIRLREKILRERVSESGLNIIYLNLVGGQDELVFDGGSMAMDSKGNVQYRAPQFEAGLHAMEFSTAGQDHFLPVSAVSEQSMVREEAIYKAVVLGVRDYVHKNGFPGAIIGLSGGIDSALTLCIAVDALGHENVEAVMMPSRYTSTMSVDDAETVAAALKAKLHRLSIEPPFTAFTECLKPLFAGLTVDATEENIQARCRGVVLMAISNKTGKLVLTTGNKSEMAVGYATLYGDMAGGFAPLKDLSKTLVYALGRWRNQQAHVIPDRILERPPTAELRENQLDQDTLPPYSILDPILERYIELDQSPENIAKAGFDLETVKKVVRMVDRNEYKRRQAAPGVRITQRAFGRDRRYPITSGYRE
ncbi:MAG: NAD+ synthase [Gammaproteobacteria bacterium]